MKEIFGGQGMDEKPKDPSRRNFLKGAVAVAGGALVGGEAKASSEEDFFERTKKEIERREVERVIEANDKEIFLLASLQAENLAEINASSWVGHTGEAVLAGAGGSLGAVVAADSIGQGYKFVKKMISGTSDSGVEAEEEGKTLPPDSGIEKEQMTETGAQEGALVMGLGAAGAVTLGVGTGVAIKGWNERNIPEFVVGKRSEGRVISQQDIDKEITRLQELNRELKRKHNLV